MVMQIGERIDLQRRRQFAGEKKKLPADLVAHIRDHIPAGHSDEFYAGVLSGLTASTTLLQSGLSNVIPQATCVVADFLESREAAI